MAFRFRKSFRIGGIKLNVTKNGLSSISLGGKGASLNIPVARPGSARASVGIPGSGLGYSAELKPKPQRGEPQRGEQASVMPIFVISVFLIFVCVSCVNFVRHQLPLSPATPNAPNGSFIR